jgi:hypothetical protein
VSSIVGTNGQADVSYSVSAYTGGSPVLDVEYSLDSGATWTSFGETDGNSTISGLTNWQTYSIQLRTVNESGYPSPSTSAVSVTVEDLNFCDQNFENSDPSSVTTQKVDNKCVITFKSGSNTWTPPAGVS